MILFIFNVAVFVVVFYYGIKIIMYNIREIKRLNSELAQLLKNTDTKTILDLRKKIHSKRVNKALDAELSRRGAL